MKEMKIGKIEKYFAKIGVAAIALIDGDLKAGDRIHIVRHTTDFEQSVDSIQIEHAEVESANPGELVAIKVADRVRDNDTVFKTLD